MPDAKTPDIIVRPCFQQDLQYVQLIYAHHCLTGTGTFEIEPPSLVEMTERWSKIVDRGWPFLVASPPSDFSRVLGFCYAAQFRDRAAYSKTFEVSIYAAPTTMRQGVGSQMLAQLLTQLRDDGVREALAVIGDSHNAASIGLHQKLGFRRVGAMTNVGEKFGRLLDVVIMQRSLPAKDAIS
ncbi:GNAT family N-acetyltransferase [Vitreimonas flagellata]|uniref:GNAT family N-acetyltransferase n=1 Tax=Vitreimonas flagellata TaxID=2560861 RepID=UPI001075647E|nr:GNAT family N-acetyltransferase [Vitreimonas flagellata]